MPRCPDCGSSSWSQFDEGPLTCLDCGTEWMVDGFHHPEKWLAANPCLARVDPEYLSWRRREVLGEWPHDEDSARHSNNPPKETPALAASCDTPTRDV